jgi:hypothetical protein
LKKKTGRLEKKRERERERKKRVIYKEKEIWLAPSFSNFDDNNLTNGRALERRTGGVDDSKERERERRLTGPELTSRKKQQRERRRKM